MAIEPTAVTIQESSEIAPTFAMLVGSMMMPEPIMLTATMNVSWTRLIFFVSATTSPPLRSRPRLALAHRVRVELDAAVHPLLIDALHLVAKAREPVERLLEGQEVVEHRPRPVIPPLAGDDHANAGRIDEGEGGGDAAADLLERHVVDL